MHRHIISPLVWQNLLSSGYTYHLYHFYGNVKEEFIWFFFITEWKNFGVPSKFTNWHLLDFLFCVNSKFKMVKWLGHSPVLNIKSVRSRKCKLQLDHLDQICKQTLRFTAVMYERPQPCQPHAAHADQVQVWRVWKRIYWNNKWKENVNNQESQFIMEWLSLFRQQGETTGSARNQVVAK